MLQEMKSLCVFRFLATIELRNWAMVSHHTGPDFTGLAFALFELVGVFHRFMQLGWLRRFSLPGVPHHTEGRRDVLPQDTRDEDRSKMSE